MKLDGSDRLMAMGQALLPEWGKYDPFAMGAACVDECFRQLVLTGADPDRIALLDNFCVGNPEDPAELGALVECVKGMAGAADAYSAPFVSGKDSFYNYFETADGPVSIPTTLLVSGMGVVEDKVARHRIVAAQCGQRDLRARQNRSEARRECSREEPWCRGGGSRDRLRSSAGVLSGLPRSGEGGLDPVGARLFRRGAGSDTGGEWHFPKLPAWKFHSMSCRSATKPGHRARRRSFLPKRRVGSFLKWLPEISGCGAREIFRPVEGGRVWSHRTVDQRTCFAARRVGQGNTH